MLIAVNEVMLGEFVRQHRDEIISRCRARVELRMAPIPSETELQQGIPIFLEQLERMLGSACAHSHSAITAGRHGADLLQHGFSVAQVVHDYGDVCQTITQLAIELNEPITTSDFRSLN